MNKCEHNLPIDQFCISSHCEWKEPGGCEQCIKKYHTHYREQKLITESELIQYLKIFNNTENEHKPNCRNIQEAFYAYFIQVKNELTQQIDLLCKTVINFIGAPYLMQNKLFNCYKRVKNKEYRRLNLKDINKFCDVAKNTTANNVIRDEGSMYKEQLKKFSKFAQNFETIISSYEDLFSQANLTFKHEKVEFEHLSSLIKQTLEITDPTTSISQFHKKSLEKNKIDQTESPLKSELPLRSFNSQEYEKNKLKQNENIIPSFYSGLLPNNREKNNENTLKKETSMIGIQSKPESSEMSKNSSSLHKLGVRDVLELEKKENKQTENSKRPSSLERNLPTYNKNLMSEMYGTKNKFKNDFKLDNIEEFFSPQIEKQKIHIADNKTKKNTSTTADIFGTENSSIFFASEESKKAESILEAKERREMSIKEAEINLRKEKLIEMMKTHQFSKKNPDPVQVESEKVKNTKKESKNSISKESSKKDQDDLKNKRVPINHSLNRSEIFEKEVAEVKKNMSLVVNDNDIKFFSVKERKYSHNEPQNNLFNSLQIDEINPIDECLSETFSIGSLEAIKEFLPENVMNGLAKLPIEEKEEKPKVLACSRLIIVPTLTKFPKDAETDSPLRKKKIILTKASPEKKENENEEKKVEKKTSSKPESSSKEEMSDQEQRSLALLIKSINQKPQDAILSLELALKESPNNLSAAEYLSYLYLEAQKPKEALTVCNKILQRFEIINQENEELLINLENNKGASLNMLGRYSETIVLLTKCITIKETDCMLKNLADAYYFSSNYEKAITFYEKAVKLSPLYDEAYHNMAVCHYLQENYQRAKNVLQKALDIVPKNIEYLEFRKHIQEKIT